MSFETINDMIVNEYDSIDIFNISKYDGLYPAPNLRQEYNDYNYIQLRDGIYQIDGTGVLGSEEHTAGEITMHGIFFADITNALAANTVFTDKYFWPYPELSDVDVLTDTDGVTYHTYIQNNINLRNMNVTNATNTSPKRQDPVSLSDIGPMYMVLRSQVNHLRIFKYSANGFASRTINGVPGPQNVGHSYHEVPYKGFNLTFTRIGEI